MSCDDAIIVSRRVALAQSKNIPTGKLHIMEINPDGSVYQNITLPGIFNPITYLHDFVVTPNWCALQHSACPSAACAIGGFA